VLAEVARRADQGKLDGVDLTGGDFQGRGLAALRARHLRAEQPQIARLRHRMLGHRRRVVGVRQPLGLVREQRAELDVVEAGEREVKAELLQVAEFETQHLLVPARVLGEFVVGNDVGLTLGFGEVSKLNRRDLVHSELASGQNATVSGYNSLFSVDQNRVCEPEFPDTGGDLSDLSVGMGARVARVGDERADRAHHDLVGQVHRCASGRCEIECETTLLHQPSRPGQALLQIGNHGFHDRSADRLWELIVVPFAELSAPAPSRPGQALLQIGNERFERRNGCARCSRRG
jgi:hypothetical protein